MRKLLAIGLILAAFDVTATAEDCPPGVKSCKVVVMSDEEINTLTGQNAVFEAAAFANRMQLGPIVEAWKKKIESSPSGTVKADVPLPQPDPRGK